MDAHGEGLGVALNAARSDVDSGDPQRIQQAVTRLRVLVARAVAEQGEGSGAHRGALRLLASGLEQLDHPDDARDLYLTLTDVIDAALAQADPDDPDRQALLEDRLYARGCALVSADHHGADAGADASERIAALDALIAQGEQTLGGAHSVVLWLLEQRARRLVQVDRDEGLQAFDLLIARAAAADEGGVNHLTALAAKAEALSRLDEDEQSALLWDRVLAGRRAVLGLDHPATLDAWGWRARTRFWSGDVAAADADLALLIPALQRARGDDDPAVLQAMRFHAGVLRRRGDLAGAAALLERITQLETARFGPLSPDVLRTRTVALEAQLDRDDRTERMPQLLKTAQSLVDDAEAAGEGTGQIGLNALKMQARVLRASYEHDGSPELAERARTQADLFCDRTELACERWAAEHPAADGPGDGPFDTLRQAFIDRARCGTPDEAFDVLRGGAERLARFGLPGRVHEIALRDELADRLRSAGRGEQALAELRHSLQLETDLASRGAWGPDGQVTAATRIAQARGALATALREQGDTAEADDLLAQAIAEAEQGSAATRVIDSLRHARALALQELGRPDEAARQLRALYDATGDIDDANDLAVVYLNHDRPAEAEALLRPLLADLEQAGTADSPTAMRVRGNLALAACRQGRDAEAAADYDRLLDLQLHTLGPTHRDTLITMHNRATEERHLGRHGEAVRRLENVLQLRTDALGARDPQTLSTLAALAIAVRDTGDLDRARGIATEAVTLSREVLGPTHPETLSRIRDLDHILSLCGAAPAEHDALAAQTRAASGGAGSDVLAALRYADHLAEQERYGDALIEYGRARDALADDPGVDWLRAERGVAACARGLGAYREAAEAYERIVPQLERLLPDDRWALADALDGLSLMRFRLDRIDEAVQAAHRAIEIADNAASDPERTIRLRIWLGRRLAGAKHFEQALAAYRDAAETASARIGAEHPLAVDATDDVAETLAALGRHRDALRVYRRNIPVMERVLGPGSDAVARAKRMRTRSANHLKKRRQTIIGGVVLVLILVCIVWSRLS
ncbi:tetratricopeptide repeat protein [Microbacterium luticocti]|uniref:tetratricopeptide repeat protein n=1 Tax=Microbacterium luticocti TaxID=451764 RepID=UPI00040E3708|nr:tetratricopeptide repeat protein [Microbacterium luticocti]